MRTLILLIMTSALLMGAMNTHSQNQPLSNPEKAFEWRTDSLPGGPPYAVQEVKSRFGKVYMATLFHGVAIKDIRDTTWENTYGAPFLPNPSARDIVFRGDTVLFATSAGLAMKKVGGGWNTFPSSIASNTNMARITTNARGQVWTGHQTFISTNPSPGATIIKELAPNNWMNFDLNMHGLPNDVTDIGHRFNDSTTWIGASGGVLRLKAMPAGGYSTTVFEYPTLIDDNVMDIEVEYGKVWIAGQDGISIRTPQGNWEYLRGGVLGTPNTDIPGDIYDISVGNEFLWVATGDYGIARYKLFGDDAGEVTVYNKDNSPLEYNRWFQISSFASYNGEDIVFSNDSVIRTLEWSYDHPLVRPDSAVVCEDSMTLYGILGAEIIGKYRFGITDTSPNIWKYNAPNDGFVDNGTLSVTIPRPEHVTGDSVELTLGIIYTDHYGHGSGSMMVPVKRCSQTTSISDNPKNTGKRMRVYPNPVKSGREINFETTEAGTLQVYDLQGQLVRERHLDRGQNTLRLQNAGVYMLRNKGTGRTQKLMVSD